MKKAKMKKRVVAMSIVGAMMGSLFIPSFGNVAYASSPQSVEVVGLEEYIPEEQYIPEDEEYILECEPSIPEDEPSVPEDELSKPEDEPSVPEDDSYTLEDETLIPESEDAIESELEEETMPPAGEVELSDREDQPELVVFNVPRHPSSLNRRTHSVENGIEGLPLFISLEMVMGALRIQETYEIPASVTIAQIIYKSGYGQYGFGGYGGNGLVYRAYWHRDLFNTGRTFNTYSDAINDHGHFLAMEYSDLIEALIEGEIEVDDFAGKMEAREDVDDGDVDEEAEDEEVEDGDVDEEAEDEDIEDDGPRRLVLLMVEYDLYRLDQMTTDEYSKELGFFVHPVPGSTVTSTFGFREFDNAFHRGIDLGTGNANLPVFAVRAGVVIHVGFAECAGNWVKIYHGEGLVTMYMHNAINFVETGQQVVMGQQIALTGTTGISTGNHLHFQVEVGGVAIDPIQFLDFFNRIL